MKKKLLIIEDEGSLAKQLKWALSKDYAVTIAGDARQARPLIASKAFPVMTLDLGLPPFPDSPEEGLKLLEEARTLSPHSKVIVITGNTETEHAIKAIGLGAVDFCAKPFDMKLLDIMLARTYGIHELEEARRNLAAESDRSGSLCGMIGVSEAMVKVFASIRQVSATNYTVLIQGESGTGKEMAARAIHVLSRRAAKPLVTINCGAIPENLLESELFGHEKGSFTGAVARKVGKFEHAQGGTVFLDEIGEMPLLLQVKILRFIQEGTVERVGGTGTISLDVRTIAATNVDLEEAVGRGIFRGDLLHRLNVFPLTLPPLRDRSEDILVLARKFLEEEMSSAGRAGFGFSRASFAAMAAHPWPGNVRELQNRIRRAVALSEKTIEPEHLGLSVSCTTTSAEPEVLSLQEARNRAECTAIRHALVVTGNNISQAARLLEVTRPTLHDLIKKHNLFTYSG